MQKKSLIAAGIAIALQTYYVPAIAANNDDDKDCPTNLSLLSKTERDKLSARCLAGYEEQDNHWGWVAGGVAALAAGVAIGIDNNGGGHSQHNNTPVPPPDDGGDVIPPDDGGDVTPPDDGGDVTPPDDGGDTPTPPDDTSVTTFSNGVTINKGKDTLEFADIKLDDGTYLGAATLSYAEKDGQWQLTTADGKTLNVTNWDVTDTNAAVIEGTQQNGRYWKYDSKGYLILANDQTAVVTGDDKTHQSDRGAQISGDNNTDVIISGDRTNNTLSGDSTVIDGATGIVITGDDTTNTISGHSSVDGGTGALISGDGTDTTLAGDITVSGGGTAIVLDGDNIIVDNTGNSNVSGAGSTGSVITGDNADISNDGELTITDGGTGGKITGDNAMVDNQGNTTVSGADSTGLYIDGNDALVINEGDQAISGGAAGTKVDGDNTRMINTGDMNVDGAGSAGVTINGDSANLTQRGDLLVTNGAVGIATTGQGNKVTNSGKTTVRNAGSVGFEVTGEQNIFNNTGNIDVSLKGTGAQISGNNSQTNLDGDINVTAVQDGDGVYRGATGLAISGESNVTDIKGSVTLSGAYGQDDMMAGSTDTLTGITVSGNNNQVTLEGALNIDVADKSSVDGQYLQATGISVQGDGNTVNLTGGITIDYAENNDSASSPVKGIIVNGDSTVTLNGTSTLNLTTMPGGDSVLADVKNGGQLTLGEDSTVNVTRNYVDGGYYMDTGLLMASGLDSVIENQGTITSDGVSSILYARDGAQAGNSGNIVVYSRQVGNGRDAVVAAKGQGSSVHNEAGGTITLTSMMTPVYTGGASKYPMKWYTDTFYGMLAFNGGEISNDAGATLKLQGAGVYGMAATKGTALNAGDIYLDGLVPTLDDEGNAIGESSYWHPSELFLTSTGMVAGSTDTGDGDATVTNTGAITVNNAGFGMMALNGGTAINQGIITLTADEGVTQTDENQLVGMVALKGGTVINDTYGTIKIEADYGKPFLTDTGAGSAVINYGTVCIGDDCQNSAEYNPTDENVSLAYAEGLIAETGETVTLLKDAMIMGDIGNNGSVNGRDIHVSEGSLTNNDTGVIDSNINVSGGDLVNDGTINGVITQSGQNVVNNGTVNSRSTITSGTFTNNTDGVVNNGAKVTGSGSTIVNDGTFYLGSASDAKNASMLEINDHAQFINTGTLILDNNKNAIHLNANNGTLYNTGTMEFTATSNKGAINYWGAGATFINDGTVNATTAALAWAGGGAGADPDKHGFFWNQADGIINYDADNGHAVNFSGYNNYVAENDGEMNISGNNAYGMYGGKNVQLVNNGTINLGTKGTTDTGMVAMGLDANATADAVIENNGAINIYASDSYAFSVAGAGHVVNNGTVTIDDSVTGSGLIKQGDNVNVEGTNGNNGNSTEVHYADYTLPDVPDASATSGSSSSSSETNDLTGYVVGTSANGSAGQLKVSNASMNGVEINTGFAAGTADTTVSFDNVVEGSNLTDAGAIQSTTVVWNAQGSQDNNGNVDVTMTKNDYADVATDTSVSDVAQALDAGYTNNELYTSLNVGTTAELNNALKQVSGSQATTVFREARVLSNRFNMLADAAPQMGNGLAFNVVAKGDPRAELGNDAQYDMLALRQKLDLTANQDLTMEYGIARLDGNGSQTAGDNGVTGGYSQFFGLKHSLALNNDGLSWNNALRYDVHNLNSSRSVAYGDVSKLADSDARQQYMEFRSEGAKTFRLMDDALKITPYAGVKFRHTIEDGYSERGAGDFNLTMNSGTETAVDSIVGLKLDYAGKNGWSASATMEGGPNLSYAKSQRMASLQGAAGQSFNVDDGQKGGGVNSLATLGAKYSSNNTALHLDAYHWTEDNISDKGFMLTLKKTFR